MNSFRLIKSFRKGLEIGLLFLITSLTAQQLKKTDSDSLLKKEYHELEEFYYTLEYTEKGKLYLQAYLKKAKLEDEVKEILSGYHLLADFYDTNYIIATKYIDSAITLATLKKYKDNFHPAALYGKKAYIERIKGNFTKALDLYLKELKLFDPVVNSFNIHYTNYNIGLLKRDYGDFEGAKSIFKKSLVFDTKRLEDHPKERIDYLEPYTLTLHELVRTYRLNKEIDTARILNDSGLKISSNDKLEHLLILNDGILDYYDEKYHNSIDKITSVLPKLQDKKNRYDFEIYNLIDAYLYLGKSQKALFNDQKALFYLKKIDSLTDASNYLVPETKWVYSSLITHYKNKEERKEQLAYIDKLLYVDSILDANYKYVNNKLESDYDIPNLIEDKEGLIKALENENRNTANKGLIIFGFLLISLSGVCYFYFKQRLYKRRFGVLFLETNTAIKKIATSNDIKQQSVEISEDTIKNILESLYKFEVKEKYLKPNITLDKLAKSFHTNSKYLSIALNTYKKQGFNQYMNELRINYVIQKLKEDVKFRKYTIKAIANEIGFNTDQAFSKAFYKKTGIYPSYFIKELEKQG